VEIPIYAFIAVFPGNALAFAAGLVPEGFVEICIQATILAIAELAFATFLVPDIRLIFNAFSSDWFSITKWTNFGLAFANAG
jgi:hypothetical protein